MPANLSTLISRVQAQLIDDGTRFNTATCTAAVRAALAKLNKRIPINSKTIIAAVAKQLTYEVTNAFYVIDVLLYDSTGAENHIPLDYDTFQEDEKIYFRLRSAQTAGVNILARYALPHTINGLDSAATSTLTADQDQVLTDGASAEALIIRGASIIESNNLNKVAIGDYQKLAAPFKAAFESGLQFYERRLPAPSINRITAWNDTYHT